MFHPVLKDIPHSIRVCEKLFDKNVLPIKKLVKDIGDLNNLTIKETKKIETTDSKIHNFSILTTSKMNIRLIDQIKIEGFQNFQQYLKTNPINVRINDSEI